MTHDFRSEPDGDNAERFRIWLEGETIDMLRRSIDDPEGTKTAIFLFVNRAFESHMPDDEIGTMFGRCFVRSGQRETNQEAAFDWLEYFGQIAKSVHDHA